LHLLLDLPNAFRISQLKFCRNFLSLSCIQHVCPSNTYLPLIRPSEADKL
jgi:hypothetical protein